MVLECEEISAVIDSSESKSLEFERDMSSDL